MRYVVVAHRGAEMRVFSGPEPAKEWCAEYLCMVWARPHQNDEEPNIRSFAHSLCQHFRDKNYYEVCRLWRETVCWQADSVAAKLDVGSVYIGWGWEPVWDEVCDPWQGREY